VRGGVVGFEAKCLQVFGDSFLSLSLVAQDATEVIMGFDVVRSKVDCLSILQDCLRQLCLPG
jgi:hypothetical protein